MQVLFIFMFYINIKLNRLFKIITLIGSTYCASIKNI